jgi:hypothetical protein
VKRHWEVTFLRTERIRVTVTDEDGSMDREEAEDKAREIAHDGHYELMMEDDLVEDAERHDEDCNELESD